MNSQPSLNFDVPARKAHLLGICGMGVGPLAIYMQEEGWQISGWDDALENSPMRPFLSLAGIKFADSLAPDVRLVGRSSAVKPGHPLYEAAIAQNARLLRRGELLAERVANKKLIAVCGSHGKTTTSGMLAQALLAAGTDAGFVLGGLYKNPDLPPAHFSKNSDWVVAEVDESDGTIKHFSPEITVAVNLDWDHPDYYKNEAELEQTFRALFERTRRAIFVPAGNARLERLTQNLRVPVFKVGDGGDFTFRVIRAGTSTTTVELGGKFAAGTQVLPTIGSFNTQNAMLALAATHFVAGHIGVPALGKFDGMRRRQDLLFRSRDLKIFADYAHHPTEISALLRLLRETQIGRLIVVFQPHRYSRTRQYAAAFANALALADRVLLMPVYSAGEAHIDGGDSSSILAMARLGNAQFSLCNSPEEVLEILNTEIQNCVPATVAFVGAGDIDRLAAIPFARECWLKSVPAEHVPASEIFAPRIKQFLSTKTRFDEHRPLAPLTTLGVGGNARWFAEPADLNDLTLLLRAAAAFDIHVFVLGRGSNLLVNDAGFDGLVISLNLQVWKFLTRTRIAGGNDGMRVGAGTRLKEICAFAAREQLGGFEFLCGIPGTLGGALRMNAGAHGNTIFDRVVSVEFLMPDGSHHTATRAQLSPVYRDCPELHGAIILSAILQSTGTLETAAILQLMNALNELRAGTQPRERSAGCTFKNPPGDSAGRIIDSLGLKGLSVGGARVSDIHANFIVTDKTATAADVKNLVDQIRSRVKLETGLSLQPEIIFLGEK